MKKVGLSRTSYEQRSSLYDDVETLIDFGFLTQNLTVNGVRMALRSMGPGDRFIMRHRTHNVPHEEFRSVAVASSIWMINGYNLLNDDNSIPRITKVITQIPANLREILFNEVMSMFNRVNAAMEAVESYAYESLSRYKWKSLGNQPFGSHNGLRVNIGTNHVQRMWTFYNQVEDQKISDDVFWDGIKFTTSAHSPKGVKKAEDRDKQNKKNEQDRRQRVQDTFFYTIRGVIKKAPDGGKSTNRTGVKSSDDLADEMRRWVAGEADWHDEIVNNYKRKVSDNYDRHKQEAHARAEVLAAARVDHSDQLQPMVAYTPDQLADILKDRGHGIAGVRQVGSGPGVIREHLYTKFLERAPDAGVLRVAENGQLAIGNTKSGPTLGQQIEGRDVVYRPQPDDDEPQEPLPNEW